MSSDQAKDSASYLKLVKLREAMFSGNVSTKNIKNILDQEGDINYKIPNTGLIKAQASKMAGCTILHLLCQRFKNDKEYIQFFNLLLDHGADITLKNSKGRTVIHEAFDKILTIDWFSDLREDPCVDLILSAQQEFQITVNPVDSRGLSHFHAACITNNVQVIEFFLNSGVSVQQSVNADSPIFAGFTPLHFATKFVCSEAVKLLLQRGADVLARDAEQMTPMHVIVNKSVRVSRILSYGKRADRKLEDCVVVIEQVAANDDDNINAKDHLGFSHLHALCTLKDSSMLERHLNDIIDVNRAVNADSPFCPGYTPLHLAALFNLNSLKLLLAKGADITIKDAYGKTPLDLCIARYGIEDIHDILARSPFQKLTLSNGKTKLTDLVYSMRSLSLFKTVLQELGDVNAHIPVGSALWPGHTPLLLAIIFHERCNSDKKKKKMFYELIEECLKKGSHIGTKGAVDQTPLQYAFRHGHVNVVNLMFGYYHYCGSSDLVEDDGLSHLHIACAAKNRSLVEKLLTNGMDVNCKLGSTFKWYVERKFGGRSYTCTTNPPVFLCSGSTPLHIAVATGDLEMVKLLLERGADPQSRDVHGTSPVHRLMTSYDNRKVCDALLSSENLRECVVDSCGLSHLHVACYLKHSNAVKKLLLEPETQVNRAICCKTTSKSLFGYRRISGLYESYVDRYGDPSVDALSVLVPFDGFAPLRIAMEQYDNSEITELLLRQGADVLAGNARSLVPLYKAMSHHCRDWSLFAALIKSDETLRRRVFERTTGLTDLHLACFERESQRISELLTNGADVNARIDDDSPFWSGCTPLHVLMKTGVAQEPDVVLQLLLDNGADVAISDGRDTPLHMTDPKKLCYSSEGYEVGYCRQDEYCSSFYYEKKTLPEFPCDGASLMLKCIKDFTSNPANDQGISHFHIACERLDVAAVEGFLKHGVDVNAKVDYFSKVYGGYTPLHVTLTLKASSPRKKRIVELLLKHGADVHAESYTGNTALHYAAEYHVYVDMSIFMIIFNAGANINAKNVDGASPLKILLKNGHVNIWNMHHFITHGCRVNDFNCFTDEGLIPEIIASVRGGKKEDIKAVVLGSPDIGGVDETGRSAIHNIVSTYSPTMSEQDYTDLIEELEKLGCDVDHQDKSGQTALHVAARFQNDRAISALLATGADINITDATGKTAFAYSLISRRVYNERRDNFDEVFNVDAIILFATHAHKLRIVGLHVNAFNEDCKRIAREKHYIYANKMDERQFRVISGSIDNVKVGSQSLTLRDFMTENGAVWEHSKLRRMDREHVVELFDAILDKRYEKKLGELRCLVKLQYKNYLARSKLVETAKIALNTLVNMPMPDLCSHTILAYLENWEMRNVIVTAS